MAIDNHELELRRFFPEVKRSYWTGATGPTSRRAVAGVGLLSLSVIPIAMLLFSALMLFVMPLMPSFFESLVIFFKISFLGTLLSLVIVGVVIILFIALIIISYGFICAYVAKFQGNRNILVPLLFGTIGLFLYLPIIVFGFPDFMVNYQGINVLGWLIFLFTFFLILMIISISISLGYTVTARGRPYCGTDHPTVMVPQDYYLSLDPQIRDIIVRGNASEVAEIPGATQTPGRFPELIEERLHIILWTCRICHSGYIDAFVELRKPEGYSKWLFASQKQSKPLDRDDALKE